MSTLKALLDQRATLDALITAEQRAARAQNLARVRALMEETGITVADLGGRAPASKPVGKAPTKVAPKYRDAAGNTWSGRGFKPVWLRQQIAAGVPLEHFRIPAG
jgi:DNA-binding protein H-NS